MFLKVLFVSVFLLLICSRVLPQQRIGIIADTQSPIWIELWWSDAERNVEATDTLFARLLQEPVQAVFFLGDLVAIGSYDPHWVPVDYFLAALRRKSIQTYAIPGNHEYSFPASAGIANFYKRFPKARGLIEVQTVDSIAMVLLDTNYDRLSRSQKEMQAIRYQRCMDSLQNVPAVRAVIVCTHQPPYTNSTGVSPGEEVQQRLVPVYLATPKAILFISGHSHNMEQFKQQGKDFLVAGGGGGLRQPLRVAGEQECHDLTFSGQRLRFFYIIVQRERNRLHVIAKGMNADDFSEHIEKDIFDMPLKF